MITIIDVLKECENDVEFINVLNNLKQYNARTKKNPANVTITIDDAMSCDMQKAFMGNAPDNHYLLLIFKNDTYKKALDKLKSLEVQNET